MFLWHISHFFYVIYCIFVKNIGFLVKLFARFGKNSYLCINIGKLPNTYFLKKFNK